MDFDLDSATTSSEHVYPGQSAGSYLKKSMSGHNRNYGATICVGMPRTCTVCNHDKRQQIEESLLAGQPFRNISKRFGMSSTALFRHKSHLPETLQKSHDADEILRADALIDHVRKLRTRTERLYEEATEILEEARRAKDLPTALAAIRSASAVVREGRENTRLWGELTGELGVPVAQIAIVMPAAAAAEVSAVDHSVPIALIHRR